MLSFIIAAYSWSDTLTFDNGTNSRLLVCLVQIRGSCEQVAWLQVEEGCCGRSDTIRLIKEIKIEVISIWCRASVNILIEKYRQVPFRVPRNGTHLKWSSIKVCPFFVHHLIIFTAVFGVDIMTPVFVNVRGCCLLPSRCRCDHQSRALWIPSSLWVSGTRKGFPVRIKCRS